MEVVRHSDPHGFLARAGPWLELAEARNNLILGIAGTLVDRPEIYEEFALWSVEEGGRTTAAAVITPPFNLVVADADTREVVEALVEIVHQDRRRLPGVLANRPTGDWFVAAWRKATGVEARLTLAQGVFALDHVEEVHRPKGRARSASIRDIDALVPWLLDFQSEALPHEPLDPERTRRLLQLRLDASPGTGMWLWDHGGKVVSLSGYGGRTSTGIRIGPVYTPPEHRRQGFATALVAEQSRWLLDNGRNFCFLYTDLTNPTSNAIYERIGYRRVAEAAQWGFSD